LNRKKALFSSNVTVNTFNLNNVKCIHAVMEEEVKKDEKKREKKKTEKLIIK
jgi:hypothetical protein